MPFLHFPRWSTYTCREIPVPQLPQGPVGHLPPPKHGTVHGRLFSLFLLPLLCCIRSFLGPPPLPLLRPLLGPHLCRHPRARVRRLLWSRSFPCLNCPFLLRLLGPRLCPRRVEMGSQAPARMSRTERFGTCCTLSRIRLPPHLRLWLGFHGWARGWLLWTTGQPGAR